MTASELLCVPEVRRVVSNLLRSQKRWDEAEDPAACHLQHALQSMDSSFWAQKYAVDALTLAEFEALTEFRLRALDGQPV